MRSFKRDNPSFFVPLTLLWNHSGLIFSFRSVHPMPSFLLVLLDLRIFRAVTDEVSVFMATSAVERELFIVELLEMGPIPHC